MKRLLILLVALLPSATQADEPENPYLERVSRLTNPVPSDYDRCYDKIASLKSFLEESADGDNEFEQRRNAKLLVVAQKKAKEGIYTCKDEVYLGAYDFEKKRYTIKPELERGGCGPFGCDTPVVTLTKKAFNKPIYLPMGESEAEKFKEDAKLSLWFKFKLVSASFNQFHKPCRARALVDCNHDRLKLEPISLQLRDEGGKVYHAKGQ